MILSLISKLSHVYSVYNLESVFVSPQESQDSPDKAPSMRQLLAESKAETSDLRRQIEELVSENNRLRGDKSTGLSNGHSSTDSVSHIHGKLAEVRNCPGQYWPAILFQFE